MDFSIVIPTIGRSTLLGAVASVITEGVPCIVVNDGCPMPRLDPFASHPLLRVCDLGRNWGRMDGITWSGQIAFQVGAYLSGTSFTGLLGDDDQLRRGAAAEIAAVLRSAPAIDMWIPGLRYADGVTACLNVGVAECGNVSHVIYRTALLAYHPWYHRPDDDPTVCDWLHFERGLKLGWKPGWIGKICIDIRPQLPGHRGWGHDE